MYRIGLALLLMALSLDSFGSERIVAIRGEASMDVVPDLIRMEVEIESVDKSKIAEAKATVDSISSVEVGPPSRHIYCLPKDCVACDEWLNAV